MAVVEGRRILPSPLPGEGTQVYFRKRRAWEDAQTPISRALARPTATLRSELLRRIPAPQLRDAPTAIWVFEFCSEAAFGRFGVYNKQTVPPGQILGLCRRTAGLRQVRLRLYGWQPREFEGLVLYFRATEVYKQRVWNPRGAEIVDYLRPFDL